MININKKMCVYVLMCINDNVYINVMIILILL